MAAEARVSVTRCSDYEDAQVGEALARVLGPLGGMERFVRPGDRVLCKCNLLAPATPAQAVCTHPSVLRAVIREIRRCGGVPVVGDNSASTPLKLTMARAGLVRVVEEEGAELVDLAETVEIRASRTAGRRTFTVSRAMLEADALVNLPKLKTHALCYMTLAVKNLYGFVPGLHKARWHMAARSPEEFSALVVDLYAALEEHGRFHGRTVHVLDGILGMEGEGPGPGGTPRSLGVLLASDDAVAVDRVACHLVGLDVHLLHTCRLGQEAGLGVADLERIEIVGGEFPEPLVRDWKPPSSSGVAGRVEALGRLGRVAQHLLLDRPDVDVSRCTGCGQCVRVCASEAMALTGPQGARKAQVALDRCIRCYCCAEVCPESAVRKVEPPPLGRLMASRWGPAVGLGFLALFLVGLVAGLIWLVV